LKKFEFIRLKLCEVNMIDDPDEAEHYVFEEIDPDLISYTYSVRGWDQLIKKDFIERASILHNMVDIHSQQ